MQNNLLKVLAILTLLVVAGRTSAQLDPNCGFRIGTVSGFYSTDYQHPLLTSITEIAAPAFLDGSSYTIHRQWQKSDRPLDNFADILNETSASYTLPLLTSTAYFREAVSCSINPNQVFYSNTVKIEVGSINQEAYSYIRVHDVLVPNIQTWTQVDQLPIGQKLQTTSYLDGLGRTLQKVSKETATPQQGSNIWGDVVQFNAYDDYGRQPRQYLPYTTTTDIGKYKTNPSTELTAYYSNANTYNETSPYQQIIFSDDPTGRIKQVNAAGAAWAVSNGERKTDELNEDADKVMMFQIDYNAVAVPRDVGYYPAHHLFKTITVDEEGKTVIQYTNKQGQLVLTKTKIDDNPSIAYNGWICVYYVYDDFGQLRFQIQPEAVKFLEAQQHSFSFVYCNTNNQQNCNDLGLIPDNLCFRYWYDDEGRVIEKKAPGAEPLRMLYDKRDRVVFMQDGNQAAKAIPEWTVNFYDELDRPVITLLHQTNDDISTLQTHINFGSTTTVTITNPATTVRQLIVPVRETPIVKYQAQEEIIFEAGFETPANDIGFETEIDPTGTVPGYVVSIPVCNSPLYQAQINAGTVIKYQFYDNYSYAGAKNFNSNFDNTAAYPNGGTANAIPIAQTSRTVGFPTGTMVRVLGTTRFLVSSEYYDEKGRHIQSVEDNIKSGIDVTTLQYSWDGRLLSNDSRHTTAGTGYSNFSILTKNAFDKIGRITSIQKRIGNNSAFKTISAYDFDDFGRLKKKHLDPGYAGGCNNELESLEYSYNIQGNITGINKDYALKTQGKYDKWCNFFGIALDYDSKTGYFPNQQRLDGKVNGVVWNTQGDDEQRKFDFRYDNAGRLLNAIFFQNYAAPGSSPNWKNDKMNFSTEGATGVIEYDLNGNLKSLLHKGYIPGMSSFVYIDNLSYTYSRLSNQLTAVTDAGTAGNANGQFGDFSDKRTGNNSAYTADYIYDANGNVVVDVNKGIKELNGTAAANGIRYNFLDKPEEIHIAGKGVVKIVYDGDGNKLQKVFTPEGSTVSTTTSYANDFVYKDDALQYINFEEGRIRVVKPVSTTNGFDALAIDGNIDLPNNSRGAFDYYVRDYQENVRMVLTEETHNSSSKCTMEDNRQTPEKDVFGDGVLSAATNPKGTQIDISQIPNQTTPQGWHNGDIGSKVSRLNKGKPIGPNVLMKVMAGDEITATTQYFYQGTTSYTSGTSTLVNDVLTSLIGALVTTTPQGSVIHNSSSAIQTQVGGLQPFQDMAAPDAGDATTSAPKAYLTVMFFDERFNYVGENSEALQVSQADNNNVNLTLSNKKAPKNGYAYVYVSNESNEYVYFDNLWVGHERGRIVEENHYYSFGLKIAAISSDKLGEDLYEGHLANKNFYNDKELIDDADVDWHDYGFRNYDAQIGRFPQLDPLTDDYPRYTPYQYASNEPIANVDVDGLFGGDVVSIGGVLHKAVGPTGQLLGGIGSIVGGIGRIGTALSVASMVVNTFKIGAEIYDQNEKNNKIGNQLEEQNDVNTEWRLEFTEGTANPPKEENKPQRAVGWLKIIQKDKDGEKEIYRFQAVSGDGDKGLLSNEEYIIQKRVRIPPGKDQQYPDERGDNRNGAYKYPLEPVNKKGFKRTALQIHPVSCIHDNIMPDGKTRWFGEPYNHQYTNGCIGLCGGWQDVDKFNDWMTGKSGLRLRVNIEGNRNKRD